MELCSSPRLQFDTGETSFRSPFKRHRANVTRTRLGSRKKGGGRRLGEVGRGVPWVSRSLGRRRVQEAPGGLTGAASAGGSFCLDLESGRDGPPPAGWAGAGRKVGTRTWKERARGREGWESEPGKGGAEQRGREGGENEGAGAARTLGADGVEKAARANLGPDQAASSF